MPNRRHSSRRFTPSCSNSITNSCRCDMTDFSDHGTPAPPQQATDADRMRQPCPRTPVHYLFGPYKWGERVKEPLQLNLDGKPTQRLSVADGFIVEGLVGSPVPAR